jgi:hypothetical protein
MLPTRELWDRIIFVIEKEHHHRLPVLLQEKKTMESELRVKGPGNIIDRTSSIVSGFSHY